MKDRRIRDRFRLRVLGRSDHSRMAGHRLDVVEAQGRCALLGERDVFDGGAGSRPVRAALEGETDQVGIERAGKAAIRAGQIDADDFLRALGHQRMADAARSRGQFGDQLGQAFGVGPRRGGRILRLLELGGGHQLHRARDLLGIRGAFAAFT
jgi:hypothetical protein